MALIPFRRSPARRFEDAVRPHLVGMYRFAYRLTGQREDAEDLVQDVLTKLFPRAEELYEVDQPGAWLNRVLYRRFIDVTRKRGRQADRPASSLMSEEAGADFLDSLVDSAAGPARHLGDEQLQQAVAGALDSLSPDQRTLLLLHDVDGWRQEDIAEVLGIAVGTVKSRLHRCRASLRSNMAKELEPFVPGERVYD
ncbi:RNA polymerase sigma-70 factor, ECF subfamily [Marinobacter daqiaonensis]|uniref:RNA polymerase sigma-70 factor, ECF subfamily n=1 Tax=Marinobacter daqiaonensis TaxID=650891 RepID=A0A1I6JWQ2_9GAMM|nr:RNA polymerase sigma factor [Marinobacter daqiaonensis]SFR83351.1 RNA polymerase sigma-70 factor, ECF subfamily [Marinobacter daqiaonensis]